MSRDELIAVITRTDAGIAMLASVLIEKGIISQSELDTVLERAQTEAAKARNGGIVASVFESVRRAIDPRILN